MTKLTRAAALTLALVAAPALAVVAQDSTEADGAAIEAMWDVYETALIDGDAEKWLSLWDEGGVQLPPGGPAVDKAELAAAMPAELADVDFTAMDIQPAETVVSGDFAFSRGVYTLEGGSGDDAFAVDGKFLTIFRRQDDGSWRIYRDAFNSNTQ